MLQIEQAAGSSTSGLGMRDDHEPGTRLASRPLFGDKGALCVAGVCEASAGTWEAAILLFRVSDNPGLFILALRVAKPKAD